MNDQIRGVVPLSKGEVRALILCADIFLASPPPIEMLEGFPDDVKRGIALLVIDLESAKTKLFNTVDNVSTNNN